MSEHGDDSPIPSRSEHGDDSPIPSRSEHGDDSPIPSKSSGGGPRSPTTVTLLLTTETIKWLVIVGALYLGVWQFCDIRNPGASRNGTSYDTCSFGHGTTIAEFWGIFTGIIMGISILVYLPWRIIAIRLRFRFYIFREERWRPAILFYILLAAVPSFGLILGATINASRMAISPLPQMEPETVTALQMVVLGLVVTEWMTKIQQEHFTYDLIKEMAVEFFFAYEVIAFIMLATNSEIYTSGWIYPSFIFSVIAMLKYLPTDPIELPEFGISWGHVLHIAVTLLVIDIPFVVIRMSTMIIFHTFLISDMIFLLKNWFIIFFSFIKLGLIFYNRNRSLKDSVPKERRFRGPEVWCDPKDGVCHIRVAAMNKLGPDSSTSIERIISS